MGKLKQEWSSTFHGYKTEEEVIIPNNYTVVEICDNDTVTDDTVLTN